MWVALPLEPRDLHHATRGSACNCPISRRVNRAIKPGYAVSSGRNGSKEAPWMVTIYKTSRAGGWQILAECRVSTNVPAWTCAYDKSKPGKPPARITFKVDIPKRFLREVPVQS